MIIESVTSGVRFVSPRLVLLLVHRGSTRVTVTAVDTLHILGPSLSRTVRRGLYRVTRLWEEVRFGLMVFPRNLFLSKSVWQRLVRSRPVTSKVSPRPVFGRSLSSGRETPQSGSLVVVVTVYETISYLTSKYSNKNTIAPRTKTTQTPLPLIRVSSPPFFCIHNSCHEKCMGVLSVLIKSKNSGPIF